MKKLYYIQSEDRHRDPSIYLFRGPWEEVVKKARFYFDKLDRVAQDETEEEEKSFFHIWAMDGDYSVTVGIPETIN